MTDKFTSSQNVADFGVNFPQNNRRTIRKKIADDQRRGTHPLNTGFDGSEFKRNYLKQEKNRINEVKKGPFGNEKGTFWTACSYCHYKFEYEKIYEERCLRCLNCRASFHAVSVPPPPPEGLSLKASYGNSSMGDTGKRHDVVEISDSDDEKEMGVEIEAGKVKAEGFNNGEGRVAMKKFKSAADFGFNPPQNNGQFIEKKIEDGQRRETHSLDTGFYGSEFKKNDVKRGPLETGSEKGTFWTACSYCHYKFEYEKEYKECCLRCSNCRKPFRAVPVAPPPAGLSVRWRDTEKRHAFVEISDSDDEEEEMEVTAEGFNNGEGRSVRKKYKSVARIRKKIAGRGMKIKKVENVEFGKGIADDCNEDELDDETFVDLRDIC